MNKILLTSFVILATLASSANARDIWSLVHRVKWGIQGVALCGGTGADAGFTSHSNYTDDVTKKDNDWNKYMVGNWTYTGGTNGRDGYNAIYYLASAVYGHGYQFCKTIVAADRFGDATVPVVRFYEPTTKDCFVLCENGYYGATCSSRDPVLKTSSIANFKAAQSYATGAVHKLANNDRSTKIADVVVLGRNYWGCGGNKQVDLKLARFQEHEAVLALKQVTSDDKSVTFTIQPMTVRAGAQHGFWLASGKNYKYAWPMVKFQGNTSTSYCPSIGFVYEDGKCVIDEHAANYAALKAAVKKAEEQERKNKELICPDWQDALSHYNRAEHEFVESDYNGAKCMKFRCQEYTTKGFWKSHESYADATSDSSSARTPYSCVSCDVATPEGGNAAKYGVMYGVGKDKYEGQCIKCETGQRYNSESRECETAKTFEMRNMVYGPSKTVRDDLKLQCWTMSEPSCYRKCMEGVSADQLKTDGCIQGDVLNVEDTLKENMSDKAKEYTDYYQDAEYDSFTKSVQINNSARKEEAEEE